MSNPEWIRQLRYVINGLGSDDIAIYPIRLLFQDEYDALGISIWIDRVAEISHHPVWREPVCNPEWIRQLKYRRNGSDSDDYGIYHIRILFQSKYDAPGIRTWIDRVAEISNPPVWREHVFPKGCKKWNIIATKWIPMILWYIPLDYFFKPSTMRQESEPESIALYPCQRFGIPYARRATAGYWMWYYGNAIDSDPDSWRIVLVLKK